MSWQRLLQEQRIKLHKTSSQEMHDLREVVERDLKDAQIPQLSADRRFATTYNAVLQLTKMVIACSGYRVVGAGAHQTTFEALELALGPGVLPLASYFDTCRRKRNQVDYDLAHVVSETEVQELLKHASAFQAMVEAWIRQHHPAYGI